MNSILLITIWFLYCINSGLQDAFTFHKAKLANNFDNNVLGFDIHTSFAFERLLILNVILLNSGIGFTLLAILGQPFFHNGSYFLVRDMIEPGTYPQRIFTTKIKDDSSAILDFDNWKTRVALLILGILFVNLV